MMRVFILFVLISLNLCAKHPYYVCVDGGGSKVDLQILDDKGSVLFSKRGGGSNINVIGEDQLRELLHNLFDGVEKRFLQNGYLVAAMAGVSLPSNLEIVSTIFEECGLNKERQLIRGDADLALGLMDEGIVLICGTGSICLGKSQGQTYRVGGLGRVLGDEGSGYQMGLSAIKAALADEYGWGESTLLTNALLDYFQVDELKSLIPLVNQNQVSVGLIAASSPIVFAAAAANDTVAEGIVRFHTLELQSLVVKMLRISGLQKPLVCLYGGVFKGDYGNAFAEHISRELSIGRDCIINLSGGNVASLYAKQVILGITP